MERLMIVKEPTGTVTEAYRALCNNVLATLGEKKILEVVGIAEESDTGTVIANLAVAIAQAGKNVLLMDCNLRSTRQHEIFGIQNTGLTDYLLSEDDFHDFIQQTEQTNLQVMPAGSSVANPIETLMNTRMRQLFNAVREEYDIVVLDVPAVEIVADAVSLGTETDGVLLVLTNKKDKVEQAQKAKEMFIQAGVPILGCVLDKV